MSDKQEELITISNNIVGQTMPVEVCTPTQHLRIAIYKLENGSEKEVLQIGIHNLVRNKTKWREIERVEIKYESETMLRYGNPPYLECSSKGDKRFSAFYARIESMGNKSIETLYQAFKIFEDGSTGLSWQEAKGKKAVNQEAANIYYKGLWVLYIEENPELLNVLKEASGLSDIFGQVGHNCQATVLFEIRNNS